MRKRAHCFSGKKASNGLYTREAAGAGSYNCLYFCDNKGHPIEGRPTVWVPRNSKPRQICWKACYSCVEIIFTLWVLTCLSDDGIWVWRPHCLENTFALMTIASESGIHNLEKLETISLITLQDALTRSKKQVGTAHRANDPELTFSMLIKLQYSFAYVLIHNNNITHIA